VAEDLDPAVDPARGEVRIVLRADPAALVQDEASSAVSRAQEAEKDVKADVPAGNIADPAAANGAREQGPEVLDPLTEWARSSWKSLSPIACISTIRPMP
jgi:hypothetical protein